MTSHYIKFYIFRHETENRLAFSVAFYSFDKNFRREIYLDTLENYAKFESLVASHGYKQGLPAVYVSYIEITWRI